MTDTHHHSIMFRPTQPRGCVNAECSCGWYAEGERETVQNAVADHDRDVSEGEDE